MLTALVQIQDAAGNRVDTAGEDGQNRPVIVRMGEGLTATKLDPDGGPNTVVTIEISPELIGVVYADTVAAARSGISGDDLEEASLVVIRGNGPTAAHFAWDADSTALDDGVNAIKLADTTTGRLVKREVVGPTGPAGADGADGADGAVGPTGPAGTLTVDSTTYTSPGLVTATPGNFYKYNPAGGALEFIIPEANADTAGKLIELYNVTSSTDSINVSAWSGQEIAGSADKTVSGAYAITRYRCTGATWTFEQH